MNTEGSAGTLPVEGASLSTVSRRKGEAERAVSSKLAVFLGTAGHCKVARLAVVLTGPREACLLWRTELCNKRLWGGLQAEPGKGC